MSRNFQYGAQKFGDFFLAFQYLLGSRAPEMSEDMGFYNTNMGEIAM